MTDKMRDDLKKKKKVSNDYNFEYFVEAIIVTVDVVRAAFWNSQVVASYLPQLVVFPARGSLRRQPNTGDGQHRRERLVQEEQQQHHVGGRCRQSGNAGHIPFIG